MPPCACAGALNAARRGQEKRANQKALTLRQSLGQNHAQLVRLFREWDEDGDGSVSRQEFRRAMPMLGLRASRAEIDDIFDSLDQDGSGTIEYHELKGLLESEANAKEFPKSPLLARNAHEEDEPMSWCQRKCSRVRRCGGGVLWLLNTVTLQTILYFDGKLE